MIHICPKCESENSEVLGLTNRQRVCRTCGFVGDLHTRMATPEGFVDFIKEVDGDTPRA